MLQFAINLRGEWNGQGREGRESGVASWHMLPYSMCVCVCVWKGINEKIEN